MPPQAVHAGGKSRRIVRLVGALVTAAILYGFNGLGSFLAHEDALTKADAIFILAGTRMTRQLEGADLFLAGYAPSIVLSRELQEAAFDVLAKKGLRFPTDADRARDVYVALGIPRDAILVPDRIHLSTAAEAITLRELALGHGWKKVIVVSTKYHLRRAGFAIRRELVGAGIDVIMHASRYDASEPDRWWRRRADIRELISEVPKLIAYMAGLGA
jgi:uncharacterized SAM-binding protein YcdF (DUF218 family)